MELTLQVDGAQLSEEVRELLDNLTPKQKQTLALQMLKQTMQDTETRFSKRVGIDQAIAEMNAEQEKMAENNEAKTFRWAPSAYGDKPLELQVLDPSRSYRSTEWGSAEQYEKSRFDRLSKFFSDPNTYFRETILKEMLHAAVTHVEETVNGSEVVQNAIDQAVAEIKDSIPAMVQSAMQRLFVNTLAQAITDQSKSLNAVDNHGGLLREIEERLQRNNIL